jgi:hypothetical protein
MKTAVNTFALVLIATILTGCSGIPVSQDYAPNTDFSALKTYHWDPALLKDEKNINGNPLLNSRIHSAIDRKLAAMNYQLSSNNKSDFTVNYQTEVRQRLTSEGVSSGISVGFGTFSNFGAVGLGTGSRIRDEDEATLMINILSGKDDSLLWRGSSKRYVYSSTDPDELTKVINEHVDAILAQFPPNRK